MLNFGQISLSDADKKDAAWRDVCQIFNTQKQRWKHELPKDCDGVTWPIFFRSSERGMIIPSYSLKAIIPRRGDTMLRLIPPTSSHLRFKICYFKSGKTEDMPYVAFSDDHEVVRTEFCYPEFPVNYFFHKAKKVIYIKLTKDMIDEIFEFQTLSIQGYPKIPVRQYKYHLALLEGVSIMTFCPSINALDEV